MKVACKSNREAQAFHPALDAVCNAAMEKDQRWQRLVDFGVVYALCINVCSIKMKNYLQSLASSSTDAQNVGFSYIFMILHLFRCHSDTLILY
jgi:hypothetical protein